MKYTAASFMVAPSGSYEQAQAVCHNSGHMNPDVRGKCLRCGEKVKHPTTAEHEMIADQAQ